MRAARASALTLFAAGLMGAAGLALQALGAHGGGDPQTTRWLDIGGGVLLAHAPVVLVLVRFAHDAKRPEMRRALIGITAAIALGAGLFAGSLAARALLDLSPASLPARATPVGGALMIGAWTALALVGLANLVRNPSEE
ncbi:MAG: DUF423 domain-containing protein [Alphaproteobacteria bacterium]|nr:MAG: DUF423 domain-containing protein [Alphaproteobacteria bacterium]